MQTLIRDYKDDPYIICPSCGRAYKGWESYNEMQDDYSEGPEEVEDPSYYLYKSSTLTVCPYCNYSDSVYGVHVPTKYTVYCGKLSVSMTPDEIMTPPAPKKVFGGFSLKPSGFSLKPSGFSLKSPGAFSLNNAKKGIEGMKKIPRKSSGRRWV